MATIKNYTDLEQSKKLAEILPLESVDGFWDYHNMWYSEGDEWEGYEDYPRAEPYLEYTREENEWKEDKSDVPCWSLVALLNVLQEINGIPLTLEKVKAKDGYEGYYYHIEYKDIVLIPYSKNPIDACYEMVMRLHELNLL